MEETELKDLAGDALILLVNIFDDTSVKVISNKFTTKLIDSMPFIVDEPTIDALVSIFTIICPYYEKVQPDDNLLIEEFKGERCEFYKQKLLYLANRGSAYRLDKAMQTVYVLLTNAKTVEFFNENDIDIIIECALRELGEKNTSRSRVAILRVLLLALEHPTYLKHYPKRVAEYIDTFETQVLHEEGEEYKSKERVEFMKLNAKLSELSQTR